MTKRPAKANMNVSAATATGLRTATGVLVVITPLATDAAWADRVKAMGYTMIATGTDTGMLQQGFTSLIQHVEKRG